MTTGQVPAFENEPVFRAAMIGANLTAAMAAFLAAVDAIDTQVRTHYGRWNVRGRALDKAEGK
jgi:hypothetical protein